MSVAFLDVKKAYDTVWHEGLWGKVREAGVGREFIEMMREWYKGMVAAVVTPWGHSEKIGIRRGVKQGSVLSPWLYSMYINGLLRKLKKK